MKYIYVISFLTFGTNIYQMLSNGYKIRKEAEVVARQLRACGHKDVRITKIDLPE